MKNTIFLGLSALFSLTIHAQLRVYPTSGNVRVEHLLINALDSVNWTSKYGIYSNHEGFCVEDFVPYGISVYGYTDATGTTPWGYTDWAIGVKGDATGGGSNFGVYGSLHGTGSYFPYGAGVYGTIYNHPLHKSDAYAGFFDGPVGVTEGLRVTGGITTGSLYTYASPSVSQGGNVENERQPASTSLTEQLSTLELGTFYGSYTKEERKFLEMKNAERGGAEKLEKTVADEEKDIATRLHYGLSAEQLEESFPSLVLEDGEGNKYINYVEMVPLLVQSIRELSAKVTALEAQLGISDPSKPVLKTKGKAEDADDVTLALPDNGQEATLDVFDLSGKLLRTTSLNAASAPDLSSYTHGLPTGTYAYSLTVNGKRQKARKIIVK